MSSKPFKLFHGLLPTLIFLGLLLLFIAAAVYMSIGLVIVYLLLKSGPLTPAVFVLSLIITVSALIPPLLLTVSVCFAYQERSIRNNKPPAPSAYSPSEKLTTLSKQASDTFAQQREAFNKGRDRQDTYGN